MSKTCKSKRRGHAARTAAGVSGLTVIMGLLNAALAGDVTVDMNMPVQPVITNPGTSFDIGNSQWKTESVSGAITGSPFASSGFPDVTAFDNEVSAQAVSNSSLNSLVISAAMSSPDFSVASAQSTPLGSAATVTAAVSGAPLVRIDFTVPLVNVTVDQNRANAAATINTTTISAEDSSTGGFAAPVAGSLQLNANSTTDTVKASGNATLTNSQYARNAGAANGSGAHVTGASILVQIPTGSWNVHDSSKSITVTDNSVQAQFLGNDSTIQYVGARQSMDGSLMVTSLQDNVETGNSPGHTASIAGSGVSIDVATNQMDAMAVVSKQTFQAGSVGNQAANGIDLDVSGALTPATPHTPTVNLVAANGNLNADVQQADLAIVNAQRNSGARLSSDIDASDIVFKGKGGGGQVTLSDNESLASASGNVAENAVAVDAVGLDGLGAAVVNGQVNRNTVIQAHNDTDIQANPTSSHGGSITIADNRVAALAAGSSASNALDLSSSTQLAVASPVVASTQWSNSQIAAQADGSTGIHITMSGLGNAGPFVVSHNTYQALATHNQATNELELESASGTAVDGARLTNTQTVNRGASTSASVTSSTPIAVHQGVNSGRFTVAENTAESQALSNAADNSLAMIATAGPLAALDTGLANRQTNAGSVHADTHLPAPDTNGVRGDSGLGGTHTVADNVASSQALGNLASSTLAFDAAAGTTQIRGADLSSAQANSGLVSASTTLEGVAGIQSNGSMNGSFTVAGNEASSQAIGNQVANRLSAAAGTANEATGVTLDNDQLSVKLGDVVTAATTVSGTSGVHTVAGASTMTGGYTVTGLRRGSEALANLAVNELQTQGTTSNESDVALSNTQGNGGNVSASTTVSDTSGLATAGTLQGSALVADNLTYSQATINQAANTVSSASTAGSSTQDASLSNVQANLLGIVTARTTVSGVSGIQAGDLLGDDDEATVAGQTVTSMARANSADNTLDSSALTANDTTAQLRNRQSNLLGRVTAVTEGSGTIGIASTGAIDGSAVVTGNVFSSEATSNRAVNILSTSALADNTSDVDLISGQVNGSSVTARTTLTDLLGIQSGGDMGTSPMVSDNAVASQAIANLASNAVSVRSVSGLDAAASLTNAQGNAGTVQATTSLTEGIGVQAATALNGVATVADNRVTSLAMGNNALNALDALSTAAPLSASLALNNGQVNTASVTSTVQGSTDGVLHGVSMGPGGAAVATLVGNTVSSGAYGNFAQNSLTAQSMGVITASASLSSIQSNTGNITASVVNGGVASVGGPGSAVISGNTVSATAVGNFSANSMVVGL